MRDTSFSVAQFVFKNWWPLKCEFWIIYFFWLRCPNNSLRNLLLQMKYYSIKKFKKSIPNVHCFFFFLFSVWQIKFRHTGGNRQRRENSNYLLKLRKEWGFIKPMSARNIFDLCIFLGRITRITQSRPQSIFFFANAEI